MMSVSPRFPDAESPQQLRAKIMQASWLSGLLWLSLGSLLIFFFPSRSLNVLLAGELSFARQVLYGLGGGLAAGSLAAAMMRLKPFQDIGRDYPIVELVQQADLRRGDIIGISLTAGISEEWLFRAGLQPLLGLWLSSFIFVALHGYFKFKNTAQIIFGGVMLLLSLLLGLLFEHSGLLSAMLAHALYDIIVTHRLRKQA